MKILVLLTTLVHFALSSNPGAYSTDFSDRSSVLKDWTLETDCSHCSKLTNGEDECTEFATNATTFDQNGMVHTTRKVDPSTSSCGAYSTSGHATWNPNLLYGNFTVMAKWFPGGSDVVSTATGFIGLDSDSNEASITMGFHGDGWPKSSEGSHKYQTGIYASVSESHNREYTDTDVSIADRLNTYGLLWTKSKVVWSFNGKIVRTVTDASIIPSIPMKLRLHTRSGYGAKMRSSATFQAQFTKFEFQPVSEEEGEVAQSCAWCRKSEVLI